MPTELSSPTDKERIEIMALCWIEVSDLLREKKEHYGQAGGFYESNNPGPFPNYNHAIGECRLKLNELAKYPNKKTMHRILVKAITWLYLVYEAEKRST